MTRKRFVLLQTFSRARQRGRGMFGRGMPPPLQVFVLFGVLATICLCTSAQKQLKPIRAALKAKNATEVLKLVSALKSDSVACVLPELFDMEKQAYILQNDALNEKAYLHQAYDTAALFNTTLAIYQAVLRTDSAERAREQREAAVGGKYKYKYRRAGASTLSRYYPNLIAGGRWFHARGRLGEALGCLAMQLDVVTTPLWQQAGERQDEQESKDYRRAAYLYQAAALGEKRYDLVPRYKSVNLADTTGLRCNSLEMLSAAALGQRDTSTALCYLEDGLRECPSRPYFFVNWADIHLSRRGYDAILTLTDTLLQRIDATNLYFLQAVGLAHFNLKHYDKAITTFRAYLTLDSAATLPYYYVSYALAQKATAIALPGEVNTPAYRSARSQKQALFREALPYAEEYRQRAPDDKGAWAPLLYRIYLALNMGREFEEMDYILSSIEKEAAKPASAK